MVYAGVVNQDLDRSAQTRNNKMSIVIPICRFLGHCWPGKVWCLRTMLSLCEPLALSGHNVLRLSFRQDFSTLRFIARFCDGDIYSPVLSLIRSCRCQVVSGVGFRILVTSRSGTISMLKIAFRDVRFHEKFRARKPKKSRISF